MDLETVLSMMSLDDLDLLLLRNDVSLTRKREVLLRIIEKVYETGYRRGRGGTVLPARTYTVGEHGPEVIVMGSAGVIVPNKKAD